MTRAEGEAELAAKLKEYDKSDALLATESEKLAEKARKLKRRISGELSIPDVTEKK